MLKRSLSVLILMLGALVAAATLPSLSTTEAAGSQRVIWSEAGLEQTSSTYWQPDLNQPQDYTSPVDLVGGTAYMRLDVVSKPSDMFVAPMVCFWRHGAKQFEEETCAAGRHHPFTSEGTYYLDLGTPSKWWQKDGSFDWTQPVSVGRIMIRDGVKGGRLLLNERCGGACYLGDDLDDHVPIEMDATLIFVPAGQTLAPPSNWQAGCPSSWTSKCRGDEASPATTTPPTSAPPTSAPATTTPATTTPATTVAPPTTASGPTTIDAQAQVRGIKVSYNFPGADLYQVRVTPDGGKTQWNEPTESTTQTLTDLEPGRRHTVEARALIDGEWRDWISTTATPKSGADDNPATTTTQPVTTTTVPASNEPYITAVAGSSSFTVSYHLPESVLFQVRYKQDGQKQQWTEPTEATTQTLSDLPAGRPYTIEVRGLTGTTWGDWIATQASLSGAEAATPVVELRTSDSRIRVAWEFDGADVFQVRSRAVTQSAWKVRDVTGTTVVNLNGLVNDTEYDVQVRAFVDGAWQPWVSDQATPRA